MQQYSDDLRRKLIRAGQNGDGSEQEWADWGGVRRSGLQQVIRRGRETGDTQAARPRHGPVSRVQGQRVAALIQAPPDATLAELGRRWRVNAPTLCRVLRQLGLPRQKVAARPGARYTTRPELASGWAAGTPSLGPAKAPLGG
jgi:transposase